MRPWRRFIISCATAWQVRMVLSRLRSSTARTSSSLMLMASFGSGLPPLAAMSPPALWTRISIGPSCIVAVSTTRAMSALEVRSPSTRMVFTPCALATSSATAVNVVPSPYSAGPFSRMPWIATSAPMAASFSAKARPSPRPAPVTNATLPLSARAPSFDAICVLLNVRVLFCREIEADRECLHQAHRRHQRAQRGLGHVLDFEHDRSALDDRAEQAVGDGDRRHVARHQFAEQ